MRQYTTPDQTAKLIELGFEKPKSVLLYAQSVDCDNNYGWKGEAKYNGGYSIGELIEMMPPKVGEWNLSIERYWEVELWIVCYAPCDCFTRATELRDALYNMCVKLKGEGVI
jgi:hypothetical protein